MSIISVDKVQLRTKEEIKSLVTFNVSNYSSPLPWKMFNFVRFEHFSNIINVT